LEGHTVFIGDDLGMKKGYLTPDYFKCFNTAIQEYVRPGDVVLDIGAHVGLTTVLLSNRVGSSGQVYAFEPYPESYIRLTDNIARNGIDNVKAMQYAVANRSGPVTFFVNTTHTGYNSINHNNAFDYLKTERDVRELSVDSIRLDDFVDETGVRPSFIKIDCQGAEYEILIGANRMLEEETGVLGIYLEFWPLAIKNLSSVEPEEFLLHLENRRLDIVVAEDCGNFVVSGRIPDARKAEFVTAVAALEKGYTNLMLIKRVVQ